MTELFLSVFNRSIEAGYLICAVIIARLLLKRTPKSMICVLWMVVGLRFLCPYEFESAFSLLPKDQISIQMFRTGDAADNKNTGLLLKENIINKDTIGNSPAKTGALSSDALKNESFVGGSIKAESLMPEALGTKFGTYLAGIQPEIINAGAYIWLAGIIFLSAYMGFSWYRIKKNVSTAVPAVFEGTLFYQCDYISSPFLFGIFSPKIYVPFSISGQELSYVLEHEKAHRSRRDHWMKPVGYLMLVCYWFHPLVWAAYILFCRDIELACDEKVIRELGSSCKKEYSKALLACSMVQKNKKLSACPVAFGEIGVKNRVKNILRYKKPAFFTLLATAVICVIVTVCFATKPERMSAQNTDPADHQGEMQSTDPADNQSEMQSTDPAGHLADLEKNVSKWAMAYCDRDGREAGRMLDDACKQDFFYGDSQSFGWSSPWPWGTGEMDDQSNYRIVSADNRTAVILYYAWTSDPHVTVWRQVITYQFTGGEDDFRIDSISTDCFDEISSAEEFYLAYPDGIIKDTRMDYISNHTYESLNQNAILSSTNIYRTLSKPDTAAVFLLNLSSDVSTKVSSQDGRTYVTITFKEDQSTVSVEMIQPNSSDGVGIWIPQTGTV